MAETNKVRFGLSHIAAGTYTVGTNDTVTLGTPMEIPGAVSLSLDPETAESVFYADNQRYYVEDSDNGFTGDLEMAAFPDAFKTAFMNYGAMVGGGIGQYKNISKKPIYLIFEVSGDRHARRTILYNVSLGNITVEHSTTEDTKEPTTESLNITVNGDNKTGLIKATYNDGDTVFSTIYSTPPVPAAPSA